MSPFRHFRLLLPILLATATAPAAEPVPVLQKPEGHKFTLLKNWTFGSERPDATIRNKTDLDNEFYYRYIWEQGKLDKFKTYWSYHRDYPEGDPKSLHVFGKDTLTLKGRIPPGGGLKERGIESGMLRGKIPVVPGMYMEMRAKLSGGVGAWPSFWLEVGTQTDDGKFSEIPKPIPEIDIFEFFNWDGRPETRIFTGNIQVFGKPADYGHPYDMYTTLKDVGYERNLDLGFDCSKDFHVFALDWVENKPVWLIDGKPIKQTYYEWHGPPAHITMVNSIGMNLPNVKQTQMKADESQWDYTIDYIRIWKRDAGSFDLPISPRPPQKAVAGGGAVEVKSTGKWQSPTIGSSVSDLAKLKANPILKVDLSAPAETGDPGWFMAKLAINGAGIERTESPKWLLEQAPGKNGLNKRTLSWDVGEVVAKLPADANWLKIELVIQGDRARTISLSDLRAEPAAGGKAVSLKLDGAPTGAAPAPAPADTPAATPGDGPIPYPDPSKEALWPGKGPIRNFPYMAGERNAFWKKRQQEQGAIAFVGDSLTGGWKNLAKDLPQYKVANRGVGGDVSRGVLFRIKDDVLSLNPKAIVIEIGNNDLTASAPPAHMLSNLSDILAVIDKEKPGVPVVLCSIPPSANPKAPVKAADRQSMNDGIRKIAGQRKNTHFCDVYAALVDADGGPKEEYFVADKLHMSDAGHQKWAELLVPIFEKLK